MVGQSIAKSAKTSGTAEMKDKPTSAPKGGAGAPEPAAGGGSAAATSSAGAGSAAKADYGKESGLCEELPHGALTDEQLKKMVPDDSEGRVFIRWRTESQQENYGFNIFRAESDNFFASRSQARRLKRFPKLAAYPSRREVRLGSTVESTDPAYAFIHPFPSIPCPC